MIYVVGITAVLIVTILLSLTRDFSGLRLFIVVYSIVLGFIGILGLCDVPITD